MPLESGDFPLLPVVEGWVSKIRSARKHKDKKFGKDAKEAMMFYDGDTDEFWSEDYRAGPGGYNDKTADPLLPVFRVHLNRVAEFVQLFLPSIYHTNPVRNVTVRLKRPLPQELFGNPMVDPMAMQRLQMFHMQEQQENVVMGTTAALVDDLINYTPNELDLKKHSRRVLLEAVIKGAGVWWLEGIRDDVTQTTMYGSFYDSIDNLVLDPDAEQYEDMRWIAKKCVHHVWEVEEEYGYEAGDLEKYGSFESSKGQGRPDSLDLRYERSQGKSKDLITYWKIWSKMGFGDKLARDTEHSTTSGAYNSVSGRSSLNHYGPLEGAFDVFGDNCYLVICPGCPFPLNLPPDMYENLPMEDEQVLRAIDWPVPFHLDVTNGWPMEMCAFHDKPNEVWPISHLKPGIGELRFLNWAFSYMASKVYTSATTILGVQKSASEDIKKALFTALHGFTAVEIEAMAGAKISDLISFIQAPNMTQDLYEIIDRVGASFDKRVGTPEILYGTASTQSRSATDTSVRQGNASIRIDDMKEVVANCASNIARKESLSWLWMGTAQDVAPIIGPARAQIWEQVVLQQPVELVARELQFRVESDSMAKPNKSTEQELMNASLQNFGPILTSLVQMGVVGPFNALMRKWAQAFDADVNDFMIPEPPPMPPPGQEQGPPQGG